MTEHSFIVHGSKYGSRMVGGVGVSHIHFPFPSPSQSPSPLGIRDHWGTRKISSCLHKLIQGVPKKTLVSVQRLLEVLKSDLQIKVG